MVVAIHIYHNTSAIIIFCSTQRARCVLTENAVCIYFVYTKIMTIYITMETTIQKWGNSLAVRVPQGMAQKLALKAGSTVAMRQAKKTIIIQATPKTHKSLKELIATIRPENIHEETDWGKPMGKEIW